MASDLLPVWTESEIKAVLAVPDTKRCASGRRNRAMILLMLRCGMRVSEIVGHERRDGGGLRIKDIDLETGRLVIRDAKDTRPKSKRADGTAVKRRHSAGRVVFADHETITALKAWLYIDRSRMAAESDHFFITHTGRPVPPGGVRRMVAGYCKRAGVDRTKAHPHACRHTFATTFLQNGGNLHVLQKILGHSDIKVTSVYLHATEADVKAAMQGNVAISPDG